MELTGQIFGQLTVIEKAETRQDKNKQYRHYWSCQCSCGKIKEIEQYALLRDGRGTVSCGCFKKGFGPKHRCWKGHEEITGHRWAQIRQAAKTRNIEFNITIQDAWDLFLKQDRKCALTSEVLYFGKDRRNEEFTASLDRIDSSKSYYLDNLQWVHKDINRMKNGLSVDYFKQLCKKVVLMNEREV